LKQYFLDTNKIFGGTDTESLPVATGLPLDRGSFD